MTYHYHAARGKGRESLNPGAAGDKINALAVSCPSLLRVLK